MRNPQPLTLDERETIINFTDGGKEASVLTYNKRWQKHIEQRLGIKPTMSNGFGGKEYLIDKKRIPLPRVPRRVDEKTRARLAKQLAAARQKAV